jgi:hypothetical protein
MIEYMRYQSISRIEPDAKLHIMHNMGKVGHSSHQPLPEFLIENVALTENLSPDCMSAATPVPFQ